MPLNSLWQDIISTPEEDEENYEIVIIDSIWGEDYSELETIEVTEQIVPHNRNIWIERLIICRVVLPILILNKWHWT